MREYNLRRYHRLIKEIKDMLGSKCILCGASENLEIDHINRDNKLFDFGKILNYSIAKIELEIKKCQLLCFECHKTKTIGENSVDHGEGLTGKRGCYCDLCKPLKREYMRYYRLANGN